MTKFSVITPEFNSYELMGRFFDSLEKQTYKDFEIVIVDDHSTDGSYEQLKEYSLKSPLNIKLFQTEKNSGPGQARNTGLDNASGEWITFVDSDDWVALDFLERINDVIEHEEVNCVIYDYYNWLNGKTCIARSMYINKGGRKTISDCMVACRNHTFGKFYKLSECSSVRFPAVRRCEDVAYVTQAIASCDNAYYYNEPLYYYRQRPTSLSNNSKMDHGDLVKAFAILENLYLTDFPLEIKNKSVTDLLYGGVLMMCKAGKRKSEILEYINEYEKKYPEWWECEIIKYLGTAKNVFLKCAKWHFVMGLKAIAFAHSVRIKKGA